VIEGISHNIGFLESIFLSDRFASGDLSTNYISEEYPDGYKTQEISSSDYADVVYAAAVIRWLEATRLSDITGHIAGREKEINTRWAVCVGEARYVVEIEQTGADRFELSLQGEKIVVDQLNWHIGMPLFKASINGRKVSLRFKKSPRTNVYKFDYLGGFVNVSVVSPRVAELMKYMPEKVDEQDDSTLLAPISGKVIGIKTKKGEKVKAGTELVVIEAMKMENSLVAESDAEIKDIKVKEGENVQADQLLIEFA